MGQTLWPGRDFGYQINANGARLSRPKALTRDDVKRIGSDRFDDSGLCVYCKNCNEYMDFEPDNDDITVYSFQCFRCRKEFSDDRIIHHFNSNPGPVYEDLFGGDK